ncbi:hypothetical protein GNY06_08360 [Elizabethkingia argentiflava]|uniref:DUF2116 family Zn-ribbon domain-containing protein n=1 Tax=Elizabethkingia argenteiflava TaxID=2681556 RepID=A0A845PW49_9FLAO|nr:hypothetical protein [Elizabethkingia argenteiflava]NAW51393.1 hypothetical protein [Elizabethkingia argenteiflava]
MQVCLECGDKMLGRSDKKFCSDGCRNAYNNKHNKDYTNLMRNTHNRLRKNYRILCQVNEEGKTKVSRQKLVALGFDFNFITQTIIYKNGSEYRFVYDQGYKILEENWILLVRKYRSSHP